MSMANNREHVLFYFIYLSDWFRHGSSIVCALNAFFYVKFSIVNNIVHSLFKLVHNRHISHVIYLSYTLL